MLKRRVDAIALLEILIHANAAVVEMRKSRLRRELAAPVAGLQTRRPEIGQRVKVILDLLRDGTDPVRRDDIARETAGRSADR